jgi:hypothetical protein
MTVKHPKQIISSLFKKYAILEENVIFADKLFVINTVINFIFKENNNRVTSKRLLEYGELITRYLNNEVDIYWQDDKLMVKELSGVGESTDGE